MRDNLILLNLYEFCLKLLFSVMTVLKATIFMFIAYLMIKYGWNYYKFKTFPEHKEILNIILYIVLYLISNLICSTSEEKKKDIENKIFMIKQLKTKEEQIRFSIRESMLEDQIKNEEMKKKEEDIKIFEKQNVNNDDIYILNKMIGIESVKEQIQRLKATMSYDNKFIKNNDITLTFAFIGNPGCGKTTVAKALASILYNMKAIKRPIYISVNANELIGQYVGQTAPTVSAAFKQAKGGLLFIDEAYSLVEGSYNNSYGNEAINQLLTELENNKDTAVVFAGYNDQMQKFLFTNPGLKSRIHYVINFPDYNANELVMILKQKLIKLGHEIDKNCDKVFLDIFEKKIKKCKETNTPFSNGRLCSNISQSIHELHAWNYSKDKSISNVISINDIDEKRLLSID